MRRTLLALSLGLLCLSPALLLAQKLPPEIFPLDLLNRPVKFHSLYRSRESFQKQPFRPAQPPRVTMPPPRDDEPGEDPDKLRWEWEQRKDVDAYALAVEQALNIPTEADFPDVHQSPFASTTTWSQIGAGVSAPTANRHMSGRIRAAAYHYDHAQETSVLYVGGSSGGLWKPIFIIFFAVWVNLTQNLPGSPAIGSFQVHSGDSDRILVGTGDSNRYPGNGIYRTLDEGTTWTKCTLSPTPNNIFSMQRDSRDATGNTILAATANGIWRTTNFGDTWTRIYSTAAATDLVQDPSDSRYWYAGAQGVGVLESSDFGLSFHPINGTGRVGITGNIAAVLVTVCNSAPNYVYAMVEDGGVLNGVYRSSNYGYNWTKITGSDTISGGQGFHARAITVDPANPAHVIAGMAGCMETTNATSGAVTWTGRDIGHADYTRFLFRSSDDIIAFNDGGYYAFSPSTGDVNGLGNLLGLNLQLVARMSGSRTIPTRLLSGLQDVGVVRTDSTLSPANALPGTAGAFVADGGSTSISPNNANWLVWGNGVYGAPSHAFRRFHSQDGGTTVWDITGDAFTSGVDIEQGGWNNTIMFDPIPGFNLIYGHTDQYLYWKPTSSTVNWQRINNGFPVTGGTLKMFDAVNNPTTYCFYAMRWGDDNVLVFDGSTIGSMNFVDRTPPLPAGSTRNDGWVSADRSSLQPDTVYYTTFGARPSRAFISFNRGVSWTDVTGDLATNLPNANYYELVANPANVNQLFLGTNVGLFRSDNFGRNWYRYMNGLPDVVDIPWLDIAFDGAATPLLHIGTWGRGWWERNLPPTPVRTLFVTLHLEGVPYGGTTATAEFRPVDGSEPFRRTATTSGTGLFSIGTVPPNNYNIWIKGPKGLARVIGVNLTSGNVLTAANLLSGDANDDNSVDVLDLDIILRTFDKCLGDAGYDARADFNLDGCADVLDLDLLLRNFDITGTP